MVNMTVVYWVCSGLPFPIRKWTRFPQVLRVNPDNAGEIDMSNFLRGNKRKYSIDYFEMFVTFRDSLVES